MNHNEWRGENRYLGFPYETRYNLIIPVLNIASFLIVQISLHAIKSKNLIKPMLLVHLAGMYLLCSSLQVAHTNK